MCRRSCKPGCLRGPLTRYAVLPLTLDPIICLLHFARTHSFHIRMRRPEYLNCSPADGPNGSPVCDGGSSPDFLFVQKTLFWGRGYISSTSSALPYPRSSVTQPCSPQSPLGFYQRTLVTLDGANCLKPDDALLPAARSQNAAQLYSCALVRTLNLIPEIRRVSHLVARGCSAWVVLWTCPGCILKENPGSTFTRGKPFTNQLSLKTP